jgi:hypothetical protein
VGTEGQKQLVVTNLDEQGNRMGPPPPPKREPDPYPEQPVYEPPPVAMQQPIYQQPSMTAPYSNISYEEPAYYSAPAPSYYSPGFIPNYPGSTFGVHLWPQFTVVQPGFGFGHKSFPHCSTPPVSHHRRSRF